MRQQEIENKGKVLQVLKPSIVQTLTNLVPSVLGLFGQRLVARIDSGEELPQDFLH